jgi:hypothetical protein
MSNNLYRVKGYALPLTPALQDSGACSTANVLSAIHPLGSSENEAPNHLVLDMTERKIYVAPAKADESDILEFLSNLPKSFKLTKPKRGKVTLFTCHHGWVVATDGGFAPCDQSLILEGKEWTTSH